MPKIICTRPNASTLISGVKFSPLPDGAGVISEEISEDRAAAFLEIPGYELAGQEQKAEEAETPAQPVEQVEQPKPAKAPRGSKAKAKEAAEAPAPVEQPAPEVAEGAGENVDYTDETVF